MNTVMAAKLRHAQDALAAVVRADFGAIETHAIALRRISAESIVLPQDTVSYSVLAEQFRETADALASQAHARSLDGVTASYVELTRTCVACHAQINREREFGDFPGTVSRRAPTAIEARLGAGS
jgi:cytochrome c556